MKAVSGELNDGCYALFSVEVQNAKSGLWTQDKALVRGSTVLTKGKFRSINEDYFLTEKAYVNYKDMNNNVQIIVSENKMAPLSRIKIGLPTPDKYVVSEFFIKGHLEIEVINVLSHSKTVRGEAVMASIREGKEVNLLDKLFMKKLGDPLVKVDVINTAYGNIEVVRPKVNIEI